jgi:hypothetical protein
VETKRLEVTPMKTRSLIFGVVAAGCALGIALPQRAAAAVTDEAFETLKKMVQQLGEKVQKLEQLHEQDQKMHEQDQREIQQLRLQAGETQKIATNAVQKAEAAAQMQPVHPFPSRAMSATRNFTLAGDAEVQFGKVQGQHSAFVLADFAPIFLFRASDNVLFEAGFDTILQNGANPASDPGPNNNVGSTTSFSLSFATLDYLLNDYVTVVAGDMLLPLGTYSERSAGWLNKIPDSPLARGVLPGSGVGVQLRGAVPVGQSGQMVTYSVYGANGPGSMDGTGASTSLDLGGNVGLRSDGAFANLHSNPSGGGRFGWFFPLKPHYDLELGVSGQSGEWDNAGNRRWSAAVVDAALHIGPYLEAKGEYINSWVDTDDLGTIQPRGWWVQAGYKLAGLNLDLPLVNNVELISRYDQMNDALGTKTDRYTLGYVYYFSNTLLLEGDYEFLHSRGPNALPSNELLFQLSYGF